MHIPYLAIIIASLVYFAIGGFWYSPILWGPRWMREQNLSEEDIVGGPAQWVSYGIAYVAILFVATALARIFYYMDIITIKGALTASGMAWLSFAFTTAVINYRFAKKSFLLLCIDAGFHLLGFLVSGIIIVLWQ